MRQDWTVLPMVPSRENEIVVRSRVNPIFARDNPRFAG